MGGGGSWSPYLRAPSREPSVWHRLPRGPWLLTRPAHTLGRRIRARHPTEMSPVHLTVGRCPTFFSSGPTLAGRRTVVGVTPWGRGRMDAEARPRGAS